MSYHSALPHSPHMRVAAWRGDGKERARPRKNSDEFPARGWCVDAAASPPSEWRAARAAAYPFARAASCVEPLSLEREREVCVGGGEILCGEFPRRGCSV